MSWHVSSSAFHVLLTFPMRHKFGWRRECWSCPFKSLALTYVGTTESVCIDIVTKMWHPPHSATAQRNFLCVAALALIGPFREQQEVGRHISVNWRLALQSCGTINMAERAFYTHTHNILPYTNIWPLLLGQLLSSCHTRHIVALTPLTVAKHTNIPHPYSAVLHVPSALCHNPHSEM